MNFGPSQPIDPMTAEHIERGERRNTSFGDETKDPVYEQSISGTKGYGSGIAYVIDFALSPIRHLCFEARYVGMLRPMIVLENADSPGRSWSLQ